MVVRNADVLFFYSFLVQSRAWMDLERVELERRIREEFDAERSDLEKDLKRKMFKLIKQHEEDLKNSRLEGKKG